VISVTERAAYIGRVRALARGPPAETVAEFSWPKSMRWGSHDVRWVRPLHSILALYSGEVVPVTFGPVTSSRVTRGHRFLAPDEFAVESIADYREKLARAHVVLDPEERMQRIADESSRVSSAEHLEVRQDPGLLAEVAGLVEDPVVLLGHFDESYLRVPQEILETAMRAHQKYFALSRPDGSLAPAFLVVANMRARDGGERIRAGNERVLRARLADAAFFWDQDRKQKLESRAEALLGVVYQAKFGEGADRVGHKAQRITELAAELAASVGADETRARRAAALAKCDLSSGVVGEFPELQGVMGRYYAEHDGEHEEVCAAIAEHYQPAGADDAVPKHRSRSRSRSPIDSTRSSGSSRSVRSRPARRTRSRSGARRSASCAPCSRTNCGSRCATRSRKRSRTSRSRSSAPPRRTSRISSSRSSPTA
jgi:glycyl-tRNA synthetase beta chain